MEKSFIRFIDALEQRDPPRRPGQEQAGDSLERDRKFSERAALIEKLRQIRLRGTALVNTRPASARTSPQPVRGVGPGSEYGELPTRAFLHRVNADSQLESGEERLVQSLGASVLSVERGHNICKPNDGRSRAWIVASGWACYSRNLPCGRRQIFSLVIPGDTIGLTEGLLPRLTDTLALTDIKLLDASILKDAIDDKDQPLLNLRKACLIERMLGEARLLDHAVRLGSLTSMERIAHLLLELHHRLQIAGLTDDSNFAFPVTQVQLGDALGLSLVQVNRTLQVLRRKGFITLASGWATINDTEGLELVARVPIAAL